MRPDCCGLERCTRVRLWAGSCSSHHQHQHLRCSFGTGPEVSQQPSHGMLLLSPGMLLPAARQVVRQPRAVAPVHPLGSPPGLQAPALGPPGPVAQHDPGARPGLQNQVRQEGVPAEAVPAVTDAKCCQEARPWARRSAVGTALGLGTALGQQNQMAWHGACRTTITGTPGISTRSGADSGKLAWL